MQRVAAEAALLEPLLIPAGQAGRSRASPSRSASTSAPSIRSSAARTREIAAREPQPCTRARASARPSGAASFVNYFDLLAGDPRASRRPLRRHRHVAGRAIRAARQSASCCSRPYDTFDPKNPSKSIPLLLQALRRSSIASARRRVVADDNPWVDVKRRDLLDAIRACAGISIDVSAGDSSVTPGGEIPVSVTRRQSLRLSVRRFRRSRRATPIPSKAPERAAANNVAGQDRHHDQGAGRLSRISQPYWLREAAVEGDVHASTIRR